MSTTITLTVNVLDQLESAPTFTRDMYSVSLAEGSYAMVCELHTSSSPHNNTSLKAELYSCCNGNPWFYIHS